VCLSSGGERRGERGLRMEPPMISVVSLVLAEPTKNDPASGGDSGGDLNGPGSFWSKSTRPSTCQTNSKSNV